jgi:hypothetical protein
MTDLITIDPVRRITGLRNAAGHYSRPHDLTVSTPTPTLYRGTHLLR